MQVLHNYMNSLVVYMKWLLVEGDVKVYEILQSLKIEYGDELSWMLPYPGDWHLLKNSQVP